MAGYVDDLESVLKEALGLLSEIIDGDQLYDPGTEEEQESREQLLAQHYQVRTAAVRIGAIPADPLPTDPADIEKRVAETIRTLHGNVDPGTCDGSYTCTAARHDATCLLTPGN